MSQVITRMMQSFNWGIHVRTLILLNVDLQVQTNSIHFRIIILYSIYLIKYIILPFVYIKDVKELIKSCCNIFCVRVRKRTHIVKQLILKISKRKKRKMIQGDNNQTRPTDIDVNSYRLLHCICTDLNFTKTQYGIIN